MPQSLPPLPSTDDARRRSVTALIAEDETNLREELHEVLQKLWPELCICASAADGDEAHAAWARFHPDVLFLDIQLPGRSGIDVARSASGRSHVVFITAYDRFAVSAFEFGAVDYVMKPFDPARLAAAVARVQARIYSPPAPLDGALEKLTQRISEPPSYLRWVTSSVGQELRLITSDEICYFQADQKCTTVVTAEQESVIYTPIKTLVTLLDPSVFWQIHRGTIVNVRQIAGITRNFRGQLFLKIKQRIETLAVSARHADLFRQM